MTTDSLIVDPVFLHACISHLNGMTCFFFEKDLVFRKWPGIATYYFFLKKKKQNKK